MGEAVLRTMKFLPIVALATSCIVLAQPATAIAWEWVAGPPKTESHPWWLERNELPIEGEAVRIRVDAPYCAGESPPVIHHLQVTRSAGRVVIRAYVRWPEPLYVVGTVEPGEPTPACADLVRGLHRTVTIGAPSRHRKLFDGYFDRPKFVAIQKSQAG